MALVRQIGWFPVTCLIMLAAISYVPANALFHEILPG
jgi:hypothetical protein